MDEVKKSITFEYPTDNDIESLKIWEEDKGGLLVPKNKEEMFLRFRVLDRYKATLFLLQVFSAGDQEQHELFKDISGIDITEIGLDCEAGLSNDKRMQLANWLRQGYELLELGD